MLADLFRNKEADKIFRKNQELKEENRRLKEENRRLREERDQAE